MTAGTFSPVAPHPQGSCQELPSSRRPKDMMSWSPGRQGVILTAVAALIFCCKGSSKLPTAPAAQGARVLAVSELLMSKQVKSFGTQARAKGLKIAIQSLGDANSTQVKEDAKDTEPVAEATGSQGAESSSKESHMAEGASEGSTSEEVFVLFRKAQSCDVVAWDQCCWLASVSVSHVTRDDSPQQDGDLLEMKPGWDKKYWTPSAWATWIITGPTISFLFAFFMFYTYGVPAGVLTLIVCSLIDAATFYYNW